MEPLIVDLKPAVHVPVRGRVVDADGRAVAGVRVRAGRCFASEQTDFPWGVESTTDADGKFELQRLRQGERVFVYADKQGVGGVKSARFRLERTEAYMFTVKPNYDLNAQLQPGKARVVGGHLDTQVFLACPFDFARTMKTHLEQSPRPFPSLSCIVEVGPCFQPRDLVPTAMNSKLKSHACSNNSTNSSSTTHACNSN
jgi:hypothetical protein